MIGLRKSLATWEFLVREAIPDVAEEVPAFGFGLDERLVLIGREGEVAVNLTAVEAQVKNPARCDVSRGSHEFRLDRLPIQP